MNDVVCQLIELERPLEVDVSVEEVLAAFPQSTISAVSLTERQSMRIFQDLASSLLKYLSHQCAKDIVGRQKLLVRSSSSESH
jgi:hypothetical protein